MLFEPAPPRRPGTVGRPRCRLPTLQARLVQYPLATARRYNALYASGKRTLHIFRARPCGTLRVATGPIRWLIKRPTGSATQHRSNHHTPVRTFFIQRWTVETTFEEVRIWVLETQR